MKVGVMGALGAGVMAALALAACTPRDGEDTAADETAAAEAGGEVPNPDGQAPADGAAAPAAPGATTPAAGPAVPAEFQTLISGYLDMYARDAAGGLPRAAGVADVVVPLRAGGEHRWPLSLQAGRTYAVIGACDNDCDNVDIVLEDASGRQVGADTLGDDYPVVQFTPTASGQYTARIRLVTCTNEPCYVGGRLLQQQ